MTSSIAAITFAAFVILLLTGQIDNAALLGGFIPARIADPGLFDGVLAVPEWLTPLSCTLNSCGLAASGLQSADAGFLRAAGGAGAS